MRLQRHGLFIFTVAAIVAFELAASAVPLWMTLPPTPELPPAVSSGYAPVNRVKIWYATFGHGEPVILLHGGLANADYWGNQVAALQGGYRVIVMDSRGHGRSTRNAQPFGYDLMSMDVLGLMDYLHIRKAAIVGWSDGAIVALDIAMRHPERVTSVFAFAANSDPSGVKDVNKSPVFTAFIARGRIEYERLSPTPTQYEAFLAQIEKMWATQPHWTAADLAHIEVPVWIADADHDEAIYRHNTEFMAAHIANAPLLIMAGVSHFAFIQDPQQFNFNVLHFLQETQAH